MKQCPNRVIPSHKFLVVLPLILVKCTENGVRIQNRDELFLKLEEIVSGLFNAKSSVRDQFT